MSSETFLVDVAIRRVSDGHDHDDNCRSRTYLCANGHGTRVFRRNRCPVAECGWVGKADCWCCGVKLDEWPDVPVAQMDRKEAL